MLAADRPEIFAIIGKSGSGKTTLARMILNIVPPSAGSIRFRGEALHHAWRRRTRLDFMRQVQPIFQNPFEAFNPLKRVDRYLFVTARRFASGDPEQRADEALRQVGLSLAEVRRRYPARTVGRAVAAHRHRACADPGAGADRRGRAGVDGRCVAAHVDRQPVQPCCATRWACRSSTSRTTSPPPTTISDRIIIMRNGRVVEAGAARAVLDNPQHPYSQLLKGAVLSADATA